MAVGSHFESGNCTENIRKTHFFGVCLVAGLHFLILYTSTFLILLSLCNQMLGKLVRVEFVLEVI